MKYPLDGLLVYVMVVVFVATWVRATFGFGETLVGLPLLALRVPAKIAAPLTVLISITVAAMIVVQDRRDIRLGGAARLVVWSLPGIPLGLWVLKAGDDHLVKGALAVIIIVFSAWSLAGREPAPLREDRGPWLAVCGFFSGVLGGAYGLNGPPLILYGTMRRWSAAHFRATLQAYFLPASLFGMAGYAAAGLWTPDVTRYYLLTLPVTIAAVWLGRRANRLMGAAAFRRYVYAGLLVTGAMLLVHAIRG